MLFNCIKIVILSTTLAIGYTIGKYSSYQPTIRSKEIKMLPLHENKAHISKGLENNDLLLFRRSLTERLDSAQIPRGDLAIPSSVAHSRRYLISQWQRAAVGATVIVFGIDKEKDLCVALGLQKGYLRHPQGYMEIPLPKEDLTHLREQGASRMNGNTGELVKANKSIEDNAVREVYEETGLKVLPESLTLLSISSFVYDNPVTIAANYFLYLPDTPALKTVDNEFADDLQEPKWYKFKDIYLNHDKYYVKNGSLEIDPRTIKILHQALIKFCDKNPQYSSLIFKLTNNSFETNQNRKSI